MRKHASWFYRFCAGSAWKLFRLFYRAEIHFLGSPYLGAAIIAPNHVSFLDPPVVSSGWPGEVHFLARESLFKVPVLKTVIEKLNTHPVGGKGSTLASMKLVIRLLKEGKQVIVFPEGTRSKDGQLQPAQPGVGLLAQQAQCAIIPVYISGTYEAWGRHRSFPRPWGKIRVVVGEALTWEHLSKYQGKKAALDIAEEVVGSILKLKKYNISN